MLSGHVQWVYCCSISPDCSMLCSAAGEKSVSAAGWEPSRVLLNPALPSASPATPAQEAPLCEGARPEAPSLLGRPGSAWRSQDRSPCALNPEGGCFSSVLLLRSRPGGAPGLSRCPCPVGAALEHAVLHPHPEAGGAPEQRGVLRLLAGLSAPRHRLLRRLRHHVGPLHRGAAADAAVRSQGTVGDSGRGRSNAVGDFWGCVWLSL